MRTKILGYRGNLNSGCEWQAGSEERRFLAREQALVLLQRRPHVLLCKEPVVPHRHRNGYAWSALAIPIILLSERLRRLAARERSSFSLTIIASIIGFLAIGRSGTILNTSWTIELFCLLVAVGEGLTHSQGTGRGDSR